EADALDRVRRAVAPAIVRRQVDDDGDLLATETRVVEDDALGGGEELAPELRRHERRDPEPVALRLEAEDHLVHVSEVSGDAPELALRVHHRAGGRAVVEPGAAR